MTSIHPEFWLVLVLIVGIVLHWQDKQAKAKPLGINMFWCALLVLLWLLASRPLHMP